MSLEDALNPRQGITTHMRVNVSSPCLLQSVKHLNPRQGITTCAMLCSLYPSYRWKGVKHLNPRQGITTFPSITSIQTTRPTTTCETPKSPPGDYNLLTYQRQLLSYRWCETPKSPPGDYNCCG